MRDKIEYVVVYAYAMIPEPEERIYVPLVLKNKPDYLKDKLNLPGGKINPGESPLEAGLRELKEETGLEDPHYVYFPTQYMGKIEGNNCNIHCIKVRVDYEKLNPSPDETETVAWYSLPELYDLSNLMPNLRVVIPLMLNDVKNWVIQDFSSSDNKAYHNITLFMGEEPRNNLGLTNDASGRNPWNIQVRAAEHYNYRNGN